MCPEAVIKDRLEAPIFGSNLAPQIWKDMERYPKCTHNTHVIVIVM